MALSPLSMRRHPCYCQDDVVTLVTMVSLPMIRDRVVAHVGWWHCCPQASVVALVAMVSLSSSMRRCSCHHCNGIVARVVMALLPTMHRGLCCCCNCDCHSHDNGAVAVVDAQAPLPLSS